MGHRKLGLNKIKIKKIRDFKIFGDAGNLGTTRFPKLVGFQLAPYKRLVWGFVSLVKPMIQNISMIFHSATTISPASHIYVSDMFIKHTKGPQGSDTRS